MLIAGFPTGALAANTYLVAPAAGAECVIIDPGQDAESGIAETLDEHQLTPVAVLATHGHVDHVWSVAAVCESYAIPAYIHEGDRYMLADPARGLGEEIGHQLLGDRTFHEPDEVRHPADGEELPLAGIGMTAHHAPGHTQGSVTYRLPAGQDTPPVLFTGDLLFAGSIGRTDLPGGKHDEILRTLQRECLAREDETVVLPGHGPQSTVGRERTSNPFLRGIEADAGDDSARR